MDNTVIYYPYRAHIWFAPLLLAIGIVSFLSLGYYLPYIDATTCLLAIMGIVSVGLLKVLYDSSRIAVLLGCKGLCVIGEKQNGFYYMPWEEVPYAYYVRSYKGHLFLVLSPKPLDGKELKSFANRAANLSKVCIDFVVVIHIDSSQNTSKVREKINNYITHRKA